MQKLMIPPAKRGLHLALSEGCGLWKPISNPKGRPEKSAPQVNSTVDDLPLGAAANHVETVAAPPRVKP